jgi:hypothetical protein
MESKTRVAAVHEIQRKDRKILKSGVAMALITGILLAALAVVGIYISDVPHFFLKVPLVLIAFGFGAAIGGGVGVWASESDEESGSVVLQEKEKK